MPAPMTIARLPMMLGMINSCGGCTKARRRASCCQAPVGAFRRRIGISASAAVFAGSAYTPERIDECAQDSARALEGVDDGHIVRVRDAFEAIDVSDHQILGPQDLAGPKDFEAPADHAEPVREAAAGDRVDRAALSHVHTPWSARNPTQ